MFRPGQEVVCIKDSWDEGPHLGPPSRTRNPHKNEVVTVERVAIFFGAEFITIIGFDPLVFYRSDFFAPVENVLNEISIHELMEEPITA